MQISLDTHTGAYHINSYDPGQLVVNLERLAFNSVIISLTELVTDWRPQRIEALQAEDFTQILKANPEVILLGTGAHLSFPDPALLAPCYARGIGVEVMDTRAACRTFEVLAAENRRVIAALFI